MLQLTVVRWKRYGHDRLYANLPDGTAAGWADCATGTITVLLKEYGPPVTTALEPHLTGRPTTPERTPAALPLLPPLTASDDLAGNVRGRAGHPHRQPQPQPHRHRHSHPHPHPDESASGLVTGALARLLGRPAEGDGRRKGTAGERRVGAELDRLRRHGWHVLHSIPLPGEADLDHLLIGPGGVFSVNAKDHPGKSVHVGDDMVKIDEADLRPYARESRSEAERVQRVLSHYCGHPVPVEPVLVFVGVTDLEVAATQLKVRVYREREVSALAPLTGVWTPAEATRIYTVARHRRAWLEA
ncbi:nuclease-related domain-containing protein [Streptomyces sp. NPDC007084]|uniref:nuclease-related domain-containing protein n=1 Tax=Streptomyces sp. NPDC007084 TaxID=3154313 RepID=UPI003455F953